MAHQDIETIMERIRAASTLSPIFVSTSFKPGCLYCAFGNTANSVAIQQAGTGRVYKTSARPDGKNFEYVETKFIGMFHSRMDLTAVQAQLQDQVDLHLHNLETAWNAP